MKKYILTVTALSFAIISFAQKSKVVSAYQYNVSFGRNQKCKELKDGLEAINAAKDHEKTKDWAKTWKYRGDLYFSILASNKEECKTIAPDALDQCTESYLKTLVLNFDDPELKKLDLKKEDGSDMMKFFTAIQSQAKVDDEMYTADIMGRKFPGLAGEYTNRGIAEFKKKDYKTAQESFGTSMLLSQLSGKMDTITMYNMALASEYAEDFETAKQIYKGLIQLKYNIDGNGPNLYLSLYNIYKNENDVDKANEILKKGRTAYPNDYNLIINELESYLANEDYEEALQNLNIALENDPNNVVLNFARGTVYESLEQGDEATKNYKKAIELKPDYFDANYNLGAFYFNKGADNINEANDLPLSESKKYDALQAKAKVEFENALPYVEKAHLLKPEDVDAGNMLIKLYTQLGKYDKAKEIKAKFQ